MSDLINQYLQMWDFLGLAQAIFTSTMGQLFYGFITLIILVPLYMRYQSLAMVSIICMLLGSVFVPLLPLGSFNIGWVLIAFGGASILWRVFHRDR